MRNEAMNCGHTALLISQLLLKSGEEKDREKRRLLFLE